MCSCIVTIGQTTTCLVEQFQFFHLSTLLWCYIYAFKVVELSHLLEFIFYKISQNYELVHEVTMSWLIPICCLNILKLNYSSVCDRYTILTKILSVDCSSSMLLSCSSHTIALLGYPFNFYLPSCQRLEYKTSTVCIVKTIAFSIITYQTCSILFKASMISSCYITTIRQQPVVKQRWL